MQDITIWVFQLHLRQDMSFRQDIVPGENPMLNFRCLSWVAPGKVESITEVVTLDDGTYPVHPPLHQESTGRGLALTAEISIICSSTDLVESYWIDREL